MQVWLGYDEIAHSEMCMSHPAHLCTVMPDMQHMTYCCTAQLNCSTKPHLTTIVLLSFALLNCTCQTGRAAMQPKGTALEALGLYSYTLPKSAKPKPSAVKAPSAGAAKLPAAAQSGKAAAAQAHQLEQNSHRISQQPCSQQDTAGSKILSRLDPAVEAGLLAFGALMTSFQFKSGSAAQS